MGIPIIEATLNMIPKGIMAEIILALKGFATQHLKFLDVDYRKFLFVMLG